MVDKERLIKICNERGIKVIDETAKNNMTGYKICEITKFSGFISKPRRINEVSMMLNM